jgi:hypothetical protein
MRKTPKKLHVAFSPSISTNKRLTSKAEPSPKIAEGPKFGDLLSPEEADVSRTRPTTRDKLRFEQAQEQAEVSLLFIPRGAESYL